MTRIANSLRVCVPVCLLLLVAATVMAADPNGTWKWKRTPTGMGGRGGRGGGDAAAAPATEEVMILELKLDGEKLTGKITQPNLGGRGGAAPTPGAERVKVEIKNGTFKDGEVAFEASYDLQGNALVVKYKGKLEDDTIKGNYETDLGGRGAAQPTPWEAKRDKGEKAEEKK